MKAIARIPGRDREVNLIISDLCNRIYFRKNAIVSKRLNCGLILGISMLCCSWPLRAGEGCGNPSSQGLELNPEIINVVFTTPALTQFTIGTIPGALVSIRDNRDGVEYAFSVDFTPSIQPPRSDNRARTPPKLLNIQVFELIRADGDVIYEEIGKAERIRFGEEYLEPTHGFTFRPIGIHESKNSVVFGGDGILILCCVECDFYTICAPRVTACGGACVNNYQRTNASLGRNFLQVDPGGSAQ